VIAAGLAEHPEHPALLYNLACAESLAGDTESALSHLERSVALEARFAEYAKSDEDFDAIRDEPRFPGSGRTGKAGTAS
jgi:hypothetical protein